MVPNPPSGDSDHSRVSTSSTAEGSSPQQEDSLFESLPLPQLAIRDLEGSLFVIEGSDGSGRSTQIALLNEWLESRGYAVRTIGLRRSNLLAKNIDKILGTNQIGKLTLALLYATDFYDQLENVMIPALRSGHIVLADRYVYTLIARSEVRGILSHYLNEIYSLALKPVLTFWLNIDPSVTFERLFKKSNAISYWESGRDLNLSEDLHESFIRYQSKLRVRFQRFAKKEDFVVIDGEASIRTINALLRQRIARILGLESSHYTPSPEIEKKWQI